MVTACVGSQAWNGDKNLYRILLFGGVGKQLLLCSPLPSSPLLYRLLSFSPDFLPFLPYHEATTSNTARRVEETERWSRHLLGNQAWKSDGSGLIQDLGCSFSQENASGSKRCSLSVKNMWKLKYMWTFWLCSVLACTITQHFWPHILLEGSPTVQAKWCLLTAWVLSSKGLDKTLERWGHGP